MEIADQQLISNLQSPIHFDALVGYNALIDAADKVKCAQTLAELLAGQGVISLAERVPKHTQRIYRLVELSTLDKGLVERLMKAEEAIYDDANDILVNWDVEDLVQAFQGAGLQVTATLEEETSDMQITAALLERWFAPSTTNKPSYGQRLAAQLNAAESGQIRALYERQLLNKTIKWGGKIAFLVCKYTVN